MTSIEFLNHIKYINTNESVTVKVTGKNENEETVTIVGKVLVTNKYNYEFNFNENYNIVFVIDKTKSLIDYKTPIFALTNDMGSYLMTKVFNDILDIDVIPNYTIDDFIKLGLKKNKDIDAVNSLLTKGYNDLYLYNILSLYINKPSLLSWVISSIEKYNDLNLYVFNYINNFFETHHNLVSFLKRNILEYKTKSDIEELISEIKVLKQNNIIFSVIKNFNTNQRKILHEKIVLNEITNSEKLIFFTLNSLDKNILKNIVKKSSVFNNYDELIKCLRISIKTNYVWHYIDFLEFCENRDYNELNFDIIYNDDSKKIAILEVKDFKTMSTLGNKSAWCISRYKSSWTDYMIENRHQYILYNFNYEENHPFSMIAFTTNENNTKVLFAHHFSNENIMSKKTYTIDIDIFNSENILSYFNKIGIKLRDIFNNNVKPKFNWDISSFKKFATDNNVKNVEYNNDSTACLIPVQALDDDIIFNKLFTNFSFTDEKDFFGAQRTFFNKALVMLIDFNQDFNSSYSVLLLTVIKSISGYDYIVNIENFDNANINCDIIKKIKNLNFDNKTLNLNNYTNIDLAYYYLKNNFFKECISILENNPDIFNEYCTYVIDEVIFSNIIRLIFLNCELEVIKKIINVDNLSKIVKNISYPLNSKAIFKELFFSFLYIKKYRNTEKEKTNYLINVIFEISNWDNSMFDDSKVLYDYVSFLGEYYIKNNNTLFLELYSKYKWYEKIYNTCFDYNSNLVRLNIFNYFISVRNFENAYALVLLEQAYNMEVCGINELSYKLISDYSVSNDMKSKSIFECLLRYIKLKLNIY